MYKEFNSLLELITVFPDEQTCIEYLEYVRWEGNVVSPYDPSSKVYKCKGNNYKCKNTGQYFNAKTGTMFHRSSIPLQKWFVAIWLILLSIPMMPEVCSVRCCCFFSMFCCFIVGHSWRNYRSCLFFIQHSLPLTT